MSIISPFYYKKLFYRVFLSIFSLILVLPKVTFLFYTFYDEGKTMESKYEVINKQTLSNLQYYMPETETLRQLADIFSVFADSTRLKILSALSLSEMCVGDLSTYLSLNQTTVSHQLRFLKNYNIVAQKRLGKFILYSVGNDLVQDIMSNGVDYMMR